MDVQAETTPHEVPTPADPPRVQARVALVLLETLRSQDLPGEILDDEDLTLTLPRRLGLSDVIEAQIRRYRQEARRHRRIPLSEVVDLMRLVVRRPDSEEVFKVVGEGLTTASEAPGWRKIYPRRLAFRLARTRIQRRLRVLFGSPVVRTVQTPFTLEALGDVLLRGDPGGDACAIVTGIAQSVLRAYGLGDATVIHSECRGRSQESCLWTLAPKQH